MATDLYCTNCTKEFEEFEDVTTVQGGVAEPFLDVDYHVASGDGPNYQTLCKECARALLAEPKPPNRVVIELQRHNVVWAIRAERPNEVVVIIKDTYRDTSKAYGPGNSALISKLNAVKEEAWH